MNILLIKLGAMGDVLRTTGVLKPLKKKYKNAELSWLVGMESYSLLKSNPRIDSLIPLKHDDINEISAKLEHKKYDLIINLEESINTSEWTSGSGSNKIGFIYEDSRILPTKTAYEYWEMSAFGPKPENDRLKKKNKKTFQVFMQEILEIDHVGPPELFLNDTAKKFAEEYLKEKSIAETDNIIGINFGSGQRWPTKRIPLEKLREIINLLESGDDKILILGGESENESLEILKREYPSLLFASCLEIAKFAALISKLTFLITTDTLAMHIAISQKIDMIALFGPSSADEVDLFGHGEKIITDLECYCCYRKKCGKDPFCMAMFNADEIIKTLKKRKNLINN